MKLFFFAANCCVEGFQEKSLWYIGELINKCSEKQKLEVFFYLDKTRLLQYLFSVASDSAIAYFLLNAFSKVSYDKVLGVLGGSKSVKNIKDSEGIREWFYKLKIEHFLSVLY